MKFLFVCSVLLLLSATLHAESWVALDTQYSYEEQSLVKNGDKVVAWHRKSNVAVMESQGMSPEYMPFVNAKYLMWASEIDCRARTEKLETTYIIYKDDKRREITPSGTGKTYPIAPGSNYEKLLGAVCKKWYQF